MRYEFTESRENAIVRLDVAPPTAEPEDFRKKEIVRSLSEAMTEKACMHLETPGIFLRGNAQGAC